MRHKERRAREASVARGGDGLEGGGRCKGKAAVRRERERGQERKSTGTAAALAGGKTGMWNWRAVRMAVQRGRAGELYRGEREREREREKVEQRRATLHKATLFFPLSLSLLSPLPLSSSLFLSLSL